MDSLQSRHPQQPECAQDWESRRAVIETLYTSVSLKDVMAILEAEHGFKAT